MKKLVEYGILEFGMRNDTTSALQFRIPHSRIPHFLVIGLLWAGALTAQDTLRWARQSALPPLAQATLTAAGDALGQVYLLDAQNAVEKYAAHDRRRLSRYTNNRLGRATALDATNPLKLLVWYADFRTVVLLDRSLTPLGAELSLIQAGFPEVRTVATAADGNLWLYDEVAFKLRKIRPDGTPIFESQDLNLLFPTRLQLTCLRDDGNRLVAADSTLGLLVFDNYAQFQKQISVRGVGDFLLENGVTRWLDNAGNLHALQIDFPAVEQKWALPDGPRQAAQRWLLPGGSVAIRRDNLLEIWQ